MDTNSGEVNWTRVCALDDIVSDTGVCALVHSAQVAVFRVAVTEEVFAIDNVDPNSQAAVLSRGLICSVGERIAVASPMYKQHFDLKTGECLEVQGSTVRTYPARVVQGSVFVCADDDTVSPQREQVY